MKEQALALCMIVKNEEAHIERTIRSVSKYIDEFQILDTGSTDKTIKILEKLSKEFKNFKIPKIDPKSNPDYFVEIDGKFRIKFAKARNLSFKDVKSDWILWLDADDILKNPQYLKPLINEATKRGTDCISCTYEYKINGKGIVEDSHPKERLLKTGTHFWEYDPENWLVHENVYPYNKDSIAEFATQITIQHEKTQEAIKESAQRNTALLTHMVKLLPNDPRVHFLLGRDALGAGKIDLATSELVKYLSMDYTPHDGLIAAYSLTLIAEHNDDYQTGLDWAMEAIKVKPDHPLGYVITAKFNLLLGNNEACMSFLEDSERRTISELDPVSQMTPMLLKLKYMLRAEVYDRKELFEEAIAEMSKWIPYAGDEEKVQIQEEIEGLELKAHVKKVRKAFMTLANTEMLRQKAMGEDLDVKPFLEMIDRLPEPAKNSKEVLEVRRGLGLCKTHKKSIAIYCQMNFEQWDAETILTKGGGGSETAVVEMARRWQKAGYNVTVYANPKETKQFEGVTYTSLNNINFADTFDIFIGWRNPYLFKDVDIKARLKVLWLQDIMFPNDYYKEVYDKIDKIVVLSPYHRSTAIHVPESKFFYTTNGINVELIEEVEKELGEYKREANSCLYCSSADRGLEPLVDMWSRINKDKKYKLTWFYGWNSWNSIRKDEEALKFKNKLIKGMKDASIVEGGRIGKKELFKQMFTSQFLTYPLIGRAETSCIVLMEAQACGLLPITTGITALEVTQQFGIKVPLDKYEETLKKALESNDNTDKYRKEMMQWARENFNWDKVSSQWVTELFTK